MSDDILIIKAIHILNASGVILYPIETVYGLGADATDKKAVLKVIEMKKRENKPMLIAVSDIKMAKKYVWWNKYADALAEKYLPGPLSLILNRKEETITDEVTIGSEKLGIRIPKNDFVLKLISNYGRPITSTSANLSGHKPPAKLEDVSEEIKSKVDMIIDKGKPLFNQPSTIVDVSSYPPKLIREGVIKFDDIMRTIE